MLTPLAGPESSGRGREFSRLRASSSAASPTPAWLGRDGGNAASHLAAWRSRRGFALDITAFDGADNLSAKVDREPLLASPFSKEHANYFLGGSWPLIMFLHLAAATVCESP